MSRGPEFRLVARNSGRSESGEARYSRNQHSTRQDPMAKYTSSGRREYDNRSSELSRASARRTSTKPPELHLRHDESEPGPAARLDRALEPRARLSLVAPHEVPIAEA